MIFPDSPAGMSGPVSPESPSPLEAPIYALGSSPAERDRLRRQSEELRAHERGIASERELDELDQAVREHLDDPHTLVMPNLLFLAWGRKPVN